MSHLFFCRRTVAPLFVALSLALATAVYAQNSAGPQPAPLPPPIVAPADIPYPGTISLLVDLTNINDRIVNVQETIPVKPGTITLLYPEWLPGTHSPSNPVGNMAGLVVMANGKRIEWVRDRVKMHAFHLDVPRAATALEANFQYLAAHVSEAEPHLIQVRRPHLEQRAFLSGGIFLAAYIKFAPSLRLPDGWKFATALETQSQDGSLIHFKDTTLNTLIDSPLYAGVNFKRVDLSRARTIRCTWISLPTSLPTWRSRRKSCNTTRIW